MTKILENKGPKSVSRTMMFLFGALLFVFLTIIASFLETPFNISAFLIFLGYMIYSTIYIPIAHKGVVLVMGRRSPSLVFNEGWNWMPKPFISAEIVDVREKSTIIEKFTVISKNRVRVIVDATIQWLIDDPCRSLSVGESIIHQGLKDLIKQVVRSKIVNISDEEALEAHEKLRNALEEAADKKSTDWGIDIANVLIGSISLEEKVIEDYEKTKREERQRMAEKIELDHVRERIDELVKMGFSLERAQEIVQTERGKVKKKIKERQFSVSPETNAAIQCILRSWRRKDG